MEHSALPSPVGNESRKVVNNLPTSNITKNPEHSSTRSSCKGVKTNGCPKTNNIGKNNPLVAKTNQRDNTSIVATVKTASQVTKKSPSSLTLSDKSKIPKRSPGNNVVTKSKTEPEPRPKELKQSAEKPQQQKQTGHLGRRQLELSSKQNLFNSKASAVRSKSLQTKGVNQNISNSGFRTNTLISIEDKRSTKCQSARSSSAAMERSASSISTCSATSSSRKTEYETNLRKIISTAGDKKNVNKTNEQNTLPWKSLEKFQCQIIKYLDEWFLSLENESNSQDGAKMEQLQVLPAKNVLSFLENWCVSKSGSTVVKYKKEAENNNKALKVLEQKYENLMKQQEEACLQLEKNFAERTAADLAKTEAIQENMKSQQNKIINLEAALEELEKEKECLKSAKIRLEEDLKSCKNCNETANKLQETERQLELAREELKTRDDINERLENALSDKHKLEQDLVTMSAKMAELPSKLQEQFHNESVEYKQRIFELSNKIQDLEADKENYQRRSEILQQEINDLQIVRKKLAETENELQKIKTDYEEKITTQETITDKSQQIQLELVQLRQTEAVMRCEVDELKVELSKAHYNICQLEQQIERDQQLLEVRSGLINSLQANEKTHRIHMEELFSQVGEKNNTINELSSELQAKSAEFRNLFATLNAKQLEVSNQEHIIKLLEENNERSQMLRVKQEDKIERMEEELARLKQVLAIYQSNVLAGNSRQHLLFASPLLTADNVDYNENFYYYASQRKRKRQPRGQSFWNT